MDRKRPTIMLTVPVPDDLKREMAGRSELIEASLDAIADPEGSMQDLLAQIDGLLTVSHLPINAALLDRCPRLRVVSNYAVGFDNVDVPEASRRGVYICNTPRVLDAAVADLTIAMLLCMARGVLSNDRYVRNGSWQNAPAPLSHDVTGRVLGLLGKGRIGNLVAQRARVFGLQVIYHKPNQPERGEAEDATYVGKEELFRRSDFLSIHCPLTFQTRGMVGAAEFALMKPSAYLINTARGLIVDQDALVAVLQSKALAGAALDVMVNEPLDPAHPLCSMANVLLQPHVGSATVETRRAMMELAVRNVLAGVGGERPEAMVNPEVFRNRAVHSDSNSWHRNAFESSET